MDGRKCTDTFILTLRLGRSCAPASLSAVSLRWPEV